MNGSLQGQYRKAGLIMFKSDMIEDRKVTRGVLAGTVALLTEKLNVAQKVLQDFDDQPESHIFDDYEKACASVEGHLIVKAEKACEGSYNYGLPEYSQEFIVNGVRYLGILIVYYGRHDKTYYYIDDSEFTAKEIINEVKE